MKIRLLGATEVEGDSALGRRDRVVLAALAIRAGDTMTVDQLAVALWGDEVPASATKVVQGSVVRLRRALGADGIETTGAGYRLVPEQVDVDVVEFDRLVARARELGAVGDWPRAIAVYRQALGWWRGEPLPELQDWDEGRAHADRLREVHQSVEEELVEALLATGQTNEALADARRLLGQASYREHRWGLFALALYRAGRQREALELLRRAASTLRDSLGIDPGPELTELHAAILRQDPALRAVRERPAPSSDACPYPGLRSFDAEQADLFAGREVEITECLARLDEQPLLVVVGASGSGKSSLVRAGLAPVLRRRGREVVVITPGAAPDANLAASLAATDSTTVLVVDQLEELFGPATVHQSAPFLAGLSAILDVGRSVVVTVRADYLATLSQEASFARRVERGVFLLSPMSQDCLRRAIEEPADRSGLRLEPGLVDLLVRDSLDEPGALPLLSHALAETWARREGTVLTVDGYRASGGINGAVAQSAERLYESLGPPDRASLHSVLQRLVTLSSAGGPVVARVPRAVFAQTADAPRLLDLLVRSRLATVDADTVVLAHESLVRAWPRLRTWLDEDVDGQRTMTHLQVSADAWDRSGRPLDELYRGARLQTAVEWRERARPVLARSEEDYLAASVEHSDDENRTRAQQLQQQSRTNRQLRVALTAVVLLLAAALAGGSLAAANGRRARSSARTAQQSATDSRAGRLAAASQSEPRLDTSLLLVRQAVSESAVPSLQGNLLEALLRRNVLSSASAGMRVPNRFLDNTFSPDGSRALVIAIGTGPDRPGGVVLLDSASGRSLSGPTPLAVTDDDYGHWPWTSGMVDGGRTIVVMRGPTNGSSHTRQLVRYDARTGQPRGAAEPVPGAVSGDFFSQDRLRISPDARTLTSVVDRTLRIWHRGPRGWSGPRLVPLPAFPRSIEGQDLPDATRFSADSRRVAVLMEFQGPGEASPPHVGFVVDLASGRVLMPSIAYPADLALSPDGHTLAVADQRGGVTLRPVGGAAGGTVRVPGASHPNAVAFSPDGVRLAVGYDDGSVAVFALDPLRELLRTPETGVHVRVVSLPADGARVMALDDESRITAYSLNGAGRIMAAVDTATVDHVSAGPPGTVVAAGFHDGRVALFDQRTLRRVRDLWLGPYRPPDDTYDPALHRRVTALAVTPDGRAVVAADRVGHLRLWSVDDGRVLWSRDDVPTSWLAVSPDGRYLATSEFTQDPKDPEAVHPDWTPVTTTVRVWDLERRSRPVFTDSLAEFATDQGHTPKPRAIVFSPDSTRLAASFFGESTLMLVYDVPTGKRILIQRPTDDQGPDGTVATLVFTPDGSALLTQDPMGAVTRHDLRAGTASAPFQVTGDLYSTLVYSHDGRWLISYAGTTQSVLSIWDARTHAPVVTGLPFPTTDGDGALAPTADGQVFIGTANGIRRLDLDVEHWKAAACELAGRTLTRQEWSSYLAGTAYRPACA